MTVPDAELTGEVGTASVKVTVTVKDSALSGTLSFTMLNMIHCCMEKGPVVPVGFMNVREVVSG